MAGKRVGQKIKLTSVDELLCVPKTEGHEAACFSKLSDN